MNRVRKEMREVDMWRFGGRVLQAEGTASAKALRRERATIEAGME